MTALENSNQKYSGSAYLAPRTKEPQQRTRHHSHSQYKDQHNDFHRSRSGHPSSAAHSFPLHTAVGTAAPRSNDSRDRSPLQISDDIHRNITRHQYAQDNILQSYELYVPELDQTHLSDNMGHKYWVIYIHGGYFRDPSVTSSSFYPALDQVASGKHGHSHLLEHEDNSSASTDITPYIAGYVSLNYRLSPHPDKDPQDPGKTPANELRNAQWPQHMYDVLAAIAHLQGKYGFGERYLLVGHSVGATMALLSTLAAQKSPFSNTKGVASMPATEPPMAVLGVSGIYDFPLLHESFHMYIEMTRNAIPNEADDVLASPAGFDSKAYADIWTAGGRKKRAVVIAHSRDDGWVDWKQVEAIDGLLKNEPAVDVRVSEIYGQHNEIWEEGTELARVIAEAVGVMRRLEQ